MKYDKCEYCGGQVKEHKVRVDHRWKKKLIVVNNTPVGVCQRCRERYFSADVLRQLDRLAKSSISPIREIKVPLVNFSNAFNF